MDVRSVAVRLSAEVSGYVAGIQKVGSETKKQLGEASKYAAEHQKSLDDLASMSGRVGFAAAAGVGLVTKAAMDWESAWAGVQKTTEGNATQMGVLEGELRDLAQTLPATHAEIAGVAEAAGQLGVERESVAEFTRTMVDLGETTNLSADEAATGLARFSNIMGTSQDDVDRLGSALVGLGNNYATTEREILDMAMRLASSGRQIGLSEGEVFGLATSLSSVGIEAEAGGTAFSRVMIEMRTAVDTNSPKLEAFARTAGMTGEEFQTAFSENAGGAIATFIQGLANMEAQGQSTQPVLEELGLTDVRVGNALRSSANAADLFTAAMAQGNEEFGRTGDQSALAIEAAKRYETTAAQVEIAWNNIKDAAIEVGDAALPILAKIAQGTAEVAQVVGDLPAPVTNTALALGAVTAVLGTGLWFGVKTVTAVNTMRTALDDLSGTAPKTTKALRGVGAAAGALAVLYTVGKAIEGIEEASRDSVPGIQAVTAALLDLRDAEVARQFAQDLGDIGDAMERLEDPTAAQTTLDRMHSSGRQLSAIASGVEWLAGKTGNIGDDLSVGMEEAESRIAAVDEALAGIVSSAGAETAAEALEGLAAAEGWSADEMDRFIANAPLYEEALLGQENAAKLAADGTADAADGIYDIADAATDAETAVTDFNDALDQLFGVVGNQDAAFVAWRRSIRTLAEELTGGTDALNVHTEAGQDNRDAIRDRVEDLVASVQADAEAGVSQDKLAAKLRNGREQILQAGEAADISRKEMRGYLDTLNLTPADIRTLIEAAGVDDARRRVEELNAELDRAAQARSARIDVTTYYNDVYGRDPYGGVRKASGGPIYGPGTTTSDSIPILASDQEHMWSAAEVAGAGGHGRVEQLRRLARTGELRALLGYSEGGRPGELSRPPAVFTRVETREAATAATGDPQTLFRDLIVPAQPGATDADVNRTARAIVYEFRSVQRAGRWAE